MEQVFVLLYGGGLLNRFLFCFNEVVIGTGFVVIWRWSLEQVFVFFMEVVIGTGFVWYMKVVIGTGFCLLYGGGRLNRFLFSLWR